MRRFGEGPVRDQNYIRRPGAYAILPYGKQILLTHQNGLESEFQLPGGGIDPGESPLSALHREVFEETGWRIHGIKRLGAFKRYAYMPEYELWAEKICHVFVARPLRRISSPIEADHTALFVDPDIAVELLGNPGDAYFLNAFLNSQK